LNISAKCHKYWSL